MKRYLHDRDRKLPTSGEVKPVFVSKDEREKLALQLRREATVPERNHPALDHLQNHDLQNPSSEHNHDNDHHHHHRRDRRTGDRQKELEAIKKQYLGSKNPKKRVVKPSEKFRFSFDWENTDDTFGDLNALYQNPHEVRLLFGRGLLAGVDRREQKKQAARHERGAHGEIRRKADVELYDAFDMRVDRHWSEKKLDEMTERDWRIFREDFNISYKGSRLPRPIRSWAESKFSPELLKAIERVGYETPTY